MAFFGSDMATDDFAMPCLNIAKQVFLQGADLFQGHIPAKTP
jgi:hypothetical protein